MFVLVGQCPEGILYCFFFPELADIYGTVTKVYDINLSCAKRLCFTAEQAFMIPHLSLVFPFGGQECWGKRVPPVLKFAL